MAVQVGRMRAGAKGGKDSLLCGARGGWRACLLLGAAFWIHGEVDVFQAALDEAHRVGPLRHGVDALLHDDGCDVLEPSTQFHLPLFLRHLQRAYAFAGCLQSAAHERGRLMCGRWRLISDKAQLHGGVPTTVRCMRVTTPRWMSAGLVDRPCMTWSTGDGQTSSDLQISLG